MKALTINEVLKFERGLDPKIAMGTGLLHKIEKLAKIIEEESFSGFSLIDSQIRNYILTISYSNDCEPEYFHNPVTKEKDWDDIYVFSDFEQIYTIILDFNKQTFIREYKFQNSDIEDWSYDDTVNDIGFMDDPENIIEFITDDLNTYDLFPVEKSAWSAAKKNKKE